MEIATSTKASDAVRWIAFFPGSLLGATAALILTNTLGRFSLSFRAGVDPGSFIVEFYANSIGPAAMAAAFVYCGARIAPSYNRQVAYILAGLGLVLDGAALLAAIIAGSGWCVWNVICAAIGIGAVVVSIHMDETDIE